MKKVAAFLLTITAPIWMFPVMCFATLFGEGYAFYKQMLKDLEKGDK